MSVNCLLLYGSYARADHNSESDIDLLSIVSGTKYKKKIINKINITNYPYKYLLERSKNGNLFVWHLVREAVVLNGNSKLFETVINSFILKPNYKKERKEATIIANMLIANNEFSENSILGNKFLLYTIRTIALSYLAEKNIPSFSRFSMVEAFGDQWLDKLWSYKNTIGINKNGLDLLNKFKNKYGDTNIDIENINQKSLTGYAKVVWTAIKDQKFVASDLY